MRIAIALIMIIVFVKTNYDFNLWKKHIPVNHTKEWFLMALSSAYSIYYFGHHSSLIWWIAYPLAALMCASFIMFFFNSWYNTKRGFNCWFLGDVGNKSAISDKFFKRVGPFWQKTIQIGLLIGSITIYILFYGQ